MNKRTIVAMFAAVAGTTVGVAGVAGASIPSSDGTIHACVQPQNGNITEIIDFEAGQRCATSESHLTWNEQGPTGLQGPKGDTGEAGVDGINGATGPEGVQGPQGTAGADGADGVAGWQFALGDWDTLADGSGHAVARCPEGKLPLSGGWWSSTASVTVYRAYIEPEVNGYVVWWTGAASNQVLPSVVCATIG